MIMLLQMPGNKADRKDIYNKGGHSVLEGKFNIKYKPRPKVIASPEPDYKY